MSEAPGRRERKKAATRQLIADRALELFLTRGFDAVGVREIADAADVAVTTLFSYFPSKEALVFDADGEHEAELISAVTDRPAGMSIPEALRQSFHRMLEGDYDEPTVQAFRALVKSTAALSEYSDRMWLRHTAALGAAIAADRGLPPDDLTSHALARFALDANPLAAGHADPAGAIDASFALIEGGWTAVSAAAGTAATRSTR